jgi:hypothetical protein
MFAPDLGGRLFPSPLALLRVLPSLHARAIDMDANAKERRYVQSMRRKAGALPPRDLWQGEMGEWFGGGGRAPRE